LNSSFKDLQLWWLALEYNFEEQLWEQLSLWWGAALGNRFETEPVWGNRFAEMLWARALGRTSLGSSFAALITFPEQLRSFGEQLWAAFQTAVFHRFWLKLAHLLTKIVPQSFSTKLFPKAASQSCCQKLLRTASRILQSDSRKLFRQC
jgi:hypothetical protein